MFYCLGSPKKLSDLGLTCPEIGHLKKQIQIAIVDDQPFQKTASLRAHGFNITELGGDIKSIEQVLAYPIVICDIKGVGMSFDSPFEGAHVLSEIRKAYPDKFLITYSGMEYDVSYNKSLMSADASATKDANTDYWISLLEDGLKAVGDPRQRWIRFRKNLIEKGIDLYDLLRLEQAFIKSVQTRDMSPMEKHVVPDEVKELVKAFASVALSQIIKTLQQ